MCWSIVSIGPSNCKRVVGHLVRHQSKILVGLRVHHVRPGVVRQVLRDRDLPSVELDPTRAVQVEGAESHPAVPQREREHRCEPDEDDGTRRSMSLQPSSPASRPRDAQQSHRARLGSAGQSPTCARTCSERLTGPLVEHTSLLSSSSRHAWSGRSTDRQRQPIRRTTAAIGTSRTIFDA